MRIIDPLYFGESIQKKKYNDIRQCIEQGQCSKIKGMYIIVLYDTKETLFEQISTKEFELQYSLDKEFDVLGVVNTDEEFQEFTIQTIELLMGKSKAITKNNLIKHYRENDNEDAKI